jgi:hypothetical protein
MGMRCSQPMGLPDKAIAFLDAHALKVNICPVCCRHDGYETIEIGSYGMFGEQTLNRYTLADGGKADEFIQHEVWDSGPVTWLGLVVFTVDNIQIKKIVWPQEGIMRSLA